VINTGKADPSRESRDHLIVFENGLLTVTGGKLTTFQDVAHAALRAVPPETIAISLPRNPPELDPIQVDLNQPEPIRSRLMGRYGNDAPRVLAIAGQGDLERVPGTNVLWVELRWAARCEAVIHLEDLLLRRVALGILLPEGGRSLLPHIRLVCQAELGWDDERWEVEQSAYCAVWEHNYSLPDPASIPDWKVLSARGALS
jgi:glycerol-3-phosphate dehydrogenase